MKRMMKMIINETVKGDNILLKIGDDLAIRVTDSRQMFYSPCDGGDRFV